MGYPIKEKPMFSPSPARPITPQNIQLADPKTRAEVAREWWSHCTPESQAQLLSDENSQVRVEACYSKRQADVSALVARGVITVQDIQQLDRLGRFTVSAYHWELCDEVAQGALLADAHHQVRSTALLSSMKTPNPA
jgi:hypothetical protein